MSETEENVALNWVALMGLAIGEECMIVPRGVQNGQGLQGELVEMVVNQNGPLMVIIRNTTMGAKVNVPWGAILMITRPTGPRVPTEAAPTDISAADLVAMAEKMGVKIPDSVQALVDAEST